ncbi:ubiquitin, partial [Clostridium saudiense]|nr:ubiquitin [Clostridium saudiense]
RDSRVLVNIPLTVVIVILFFGFWIILPLIIVGLFFDIEFMILSQKLYTDNIDKVNNVFNKISKVVKDIKKKF